MTRDGVGRATRISSFESFSAELGVTGLIAIILPALITGRFIAGGTTLDLDAAVIAAMLAVGAGIFLLRRMSAFPGTTVFAYIVPAYAMAYGAALAVMLIARFDYSRLFLTSSFVGAILTAYLLRFYLAQVSRRRFYYVPLGHVDIVQQTPDIDWVAMTAPQVPAERCSGIVADLRHDFPDEWERMLAQAAVNGHPVYHVKQVAESLTGRVSIEHMSENSLGSLLPNLAYVRLKRLIDLLGVVVLAPLFVPPMLVIALAIRLGSPGPALFRQERMGYRGQPFTVFKFRTMRERIAPPPGTELDDCVTQTDDDRITRIGRFLRRTRIDELPQMINIVRGEMSWIGPRPEAIPLSRWYEAEIPFYVYRHIVRPGISGWAQVNQGHVADLQAVRYKLQYDFFYIKNFSAWLDVLIAFKTLGTVASGAGAK